MHLNRLCRLALVRMRQVPLVVQPDADDAQLEEAIDRYLDQQLVTLNAVRAYVAVYWWQSIRGAAAPAESLVRILVNAQVTEHDARCTLGRICENENFRIRGDKDSRLFTLTDGPPLRAG